MKTTDSLERFTGQRTVLLTTFRRNGAPVGTPVNIAVAGDHAYFRTYDRAGKVKRLRGNPEVEIAPSTFRGHPTGPPIRARTHRVTCQENAAASGLIAAKHPVLQGILVPLMHRVRRYRTLHYAVEPLGDMESVGTSQ